MLEVLLNVIINADNAYIVHVVRERSLHHDQVPPLVPLLQVSVYVLELIVDIERLEILELCLHLLLHPMAPVPVLRPIHPILTPI